MVTTATQQKIEVFETKLKKFKRELTEEEKVNALLDTILKLQKALSGINSFMEEFNNHLIDLINKRETSTYLAVKKGLNTIKITLIKLSNTFTRKMGKELSIGLKSYTTQFKVLLSEYCEILNDMKLVFEDSDESSSLDTLFHKIKSL